jgi:phage shock protein E
MGCSKGYAVRHPGGNYLTDPLLLHQAGQKEDLSTMKNICIAFFAVCILISCAQGGFKEEEIIIDENSTVIDVRTEQEYKAGHLKNSINIPHGEIKDTIAEHVRDKNQKIIVYCRSGRRSDIAKKTLDEMGYTNVINAGAYEKLKKNEQGNQKE